MASALLNIRHNLDPATKELFSRQAGERGLSHGEWLTVLVLAVADDPAVGKIVREVLARRKTLAETIQSGMSG